MTNTWTITVVEDGEDLILPFPNELMERQGWQEGDTLEWIDNGDGSWTLRKVDDDTQTEARGNETNPAQINRWAAWNFYADVLSIRFGQRHQ